MHTPSFQVLKSHVWLVAPTLDHAALNDEIHINNGNSSERSDGAFHVPGPGHFPSGDNMSRSVSRNDEAHSAAEETTAWPRSHAERRGRAGSEPRPSTAAQRYKGCRRKSP